jgi:hypothetical protein
MTESKMTTLQTSEIETDLNKYISFLNNIANTNICNYEDWNTLQSLRFNNIDYMCTDFYFKEIQKSELNSTKISWYYLELGIYGIYYYSKIIPSRILDNSIDKDITKKYLTLSADLGNTYALIHLSYLLGNNMSVNTNEKAKLYKAAADLNNPVAAAEYAELLYNYSFSIDSADDPKIYLLKALELGNYSVSTTLFSKILFNVKQNITEDMKTKSIKYLEIVIAHNLLNLVKFAIISNIERIFKIDPDFAIQILIIASVNSDIQNFIDEHKYFKHIIACTLSNKTLKQEISELRILKSYTQNDLVFNLSSEYISDK